MEHLEPAEEAPAATRSSARLAGIAAAVLAAVALMAVVLVQSGNGETKEGDPQRTAQSGATPAPAPGEATSTTAGGSATTVSPVAPAAGGATTTTVPPPSTPSSPDDYKYQVTLSASCVRAGESMTIVMHLEPEAVGSLMVLYSDHHNHGAKHHGVAGADGRIAYTFTVTPTLGRATVYASAQRRSDGKGGSTTLAFDVVAPAQAC